MNKNKDNRGFSLVELIIVIAIMAILVGVLTPQFVKYINKSAISKDMQNVQQLKTAIEVYAAGNEGLDNNIVLDSTTSQITITSGVTVDDLPGVTIPIEYSHTWTGSATYTFSKSDFKWAITTGETKTTYDSKDYSINDIFK